MGTKTDNHLTFYPIDANTINNDNNFDVFVQKIRQGPCDNYMLNLTDIQPVTCQSGGSASAVLLHSNFPIAYSWNSSPLIEQPSAQFTNPGIYSVTAISNECSLTSSVYIDGPVYQNESDLQINFSGGFFRPTFPTTVIINASNNGCAPLDATIKFVVDSFCSFQSSIPAPDLIIGDTLIWNENSFVYSADAFEIEVNLETNLSANIGDSVNIKAIISSINNEVDYTNNSQTGIYPVVNSYDPNNKEFSPQGKCDQHYILPNQKLTTTINFQNTGNEKAINVFILDTLSSFLDLQSLRIINSSHSMQLEILEGSILKFQFSNIMLIDSATNEQMSKGFVTYEIDLLENVLPQSIIIHPAAQIYFDFNPPIYTNAGFHTLVNTIPVCVASIHDFKDYSSIFPNPTKDYFQIVSTNNELTQIEIYSLTGILVDKKENWLSKTNDIIQTSDYSSGIYLVKISSETKVDFHKLIVVK